jgi:hypothetical protein
VGGNDDAVQVGDRRRRALVDLPGGQPADGSGRVAQASATTVDLSPRVNAPWAVHVTHMCVMNPAVPRFSLPARPTSLPRSVFAKALGGLLRHGRLTLDGRDPVVDPADRPAHVVRGVRPAAIDDVDDLPARLADRASGSAAGSGAACRPVSSITRRV